ARCRGDIEFPNVVEQPKVAPGVETLTAEHPEVTCSIGPGNAAPATARNRATGNRDAAGRTASLRTVDGAAIFELKRGGIPEASCGATNNGQVRRNPPTWQPPAVVIQGGDGRGGWPNPHVVQVTGYTIQT